MVECADVELPCSINVAEAAFGVGTTKPFGQKCRQKSVVKAELSNECGSVSAGSAWSQGASRNLGW